MSLLATCRRRKRSIAAFAIALLALAGFAAWEWPARRAARDARRALAVGRYDDAWKAVERWLRLRPRAAEAHYLRAKAAIALGRRRDISDGLKQAKALGYAEDRLAVLHALLDAQQGRLAKARPVLAKAFAESQTPDPMLDEALARVYLETYDFPHAGAVLSRWAKEAPRDPRPPLWHAEVHRRRNAEPEVIIADYQEALKRDPALAEARLGLAEQLYRSHRNREAGHAYTAYLVLRPGDPAGYLGAGRNAGELGDEDTAIRHVDRALELDPENAAAHLERGKIDLRRGDPSAALPRLDRAVALAPFDQATHYHRSLALKRLGRADEAAAEHATFARLQREGTELEELQERLSESPTDPHLQSQIARWMFTHGYEAEAVKWSQKILTDTPGHAETCFLLADYYERHGQADQAEALRRQARSASHARGR